MPCSADAERLFAALDNSNMDEVNACLDRAPKCVDERDDEQRSPLHYAADCADIATFRRLLDLTPELIDAQDDAGFTPLLVAVMAGNVDVLELLIERGAKLTHVDTQKHSASHWAVVCAQVKAMECLLRHGAPFETADVYGARPLHYATVIGDLSVERAETILHLLLKERADVNVSDSDGRTPLIWSASNGNEEGFQSLIQAGANKFATDNDRLGVLHCAAYHGHAAIVRMFLEQCDQPDQFVNAKDRNGDTPLFYACTYGHHECAKILLDNGADANHTDKRCRCAAHCAAAKGQLRIMKLLRQYGASFQLQNHHGDLPFHEAVQTGSISLVEWLLQHDGKFVSAANFYGRTPLHLAAASGNMELTVLLCNRGSKINPLMLYRGELYTPLDLAHRRNHALIVDYLTQRHEAQSAAQLSAEKQSTQRNSIQERLKTAKLRRIRAQISSSSSNELDSDGGVEQGGFRAARRRATDAKNGGVELISGFSVNGRKYKIFRRNKSMLGRNTDSADFIESFDDPEFFISRNVKSAPGIRTKSLPKSTSTTDLSMGGSLPQPEAERLEEFTNPKGEHVNGEPFEDPPNSKTNGKADEDDGGVEHTLVEATIRKVMNESLAAQPPEFATTGTMTDIDISDEDKAGTNFSAMGTQDSMNSTGALNKKPIKHVQLVDSISNELKVDESRPRLISPPFGSTYYYQENERVTRRRRSSQAKDQSSKEDEDGDGDDEGALMITSQHYQTSRHQIQSAKKKKQRGANKIAGPIVATNAPGPAVQITELHIFEEGWHPSIHSAHPPDNDAASVAAIEKRYVHEKAIFEELTHLKRMQIQYGRVQEHVLVRTLIANFCKMHGLNPTHFRYKTFNEWEKFLYDQLKMIYLEERDRILPPGAALLKSGGLLGAGVPPPILPSTQRSRGAGPNGSHLSILSSLASSSLRFENRLRKASPLDERLRELARIYSNSSVSASTARQRRLASSLPRRHPAVSAADSAKVPPLFLPKRASIHGVSRAHNSDAENGVIAAPNASARASERTAAGGGKRCECLTRQQPKDTIHQ